MYMYVLNAHAWKGCVMSVRVCISIDGCVFSLRGGVCCIVMYMYMYMYVCIFMSILYIIFGMNVLVFLYFMVCIIHF